MKTHILTISLATLIVTSVGCESSISQLLSSNNADYRSGVDLNNLTPNMNGLAQTYSENDAGIAVTNNENDRMYMDDLRRAMLLDKPSILSPIPVVGN